MKRSSTASLIFWAPVAVALASFFPEAISWAPATREPAYFALTRNRSRRVFQPFLSFAITDGWFSLNHLPLTHPIDESNDDIPNLVVLIPAYNEEDRIQTTIEAYREFLQGSKWTAEILVVDDGSKDRTVQVVNSFCIGTDDACPVKYLSLPTNQGKGAALAAGIKCIADTCFEKGINSTLILTQDADGSGDLQYLETMFECMKDLLAHPCDGAADATEHDAENEDDQQLHRLSIGWAQRAIVTGNRNYNFASPRGITRWGFQTAVKLIMNDLRVQDSQCGYKLMTLNAAKELYEDLEVNGWAHDVEVLYRAKLVNMPIREVPIDWMDKDGSKVVESGVARVSLQMLLDVIKVRWQYSNIRAWLNLGDF